MRLARIWRGAELTFRKNKTSRQIVCRVPYPEKDIAWRFRYRRKYLGGLSRPPCHSKNTNLREEWAKACDAVGFGKRKRENRKAAQGTRGIVIQGSLITTSAAARREI